MSAGDYQLKRIIGSGSRSVAYIASKIESIIDKTEDVCIKVYKKNKLRKMKFLTGSRTGGMGRYYSALDEVQSEIKILESISHTHIIYLHEVIEDDEEDTISLVLTLAPLGALLTPISDSFQYQYNPHLLTLFSSNPLTHTILSIFCCWIDQICQAVEYLHSRQIVHHDIKPDNILLLSSSHILLSDLNSARQYADLNAMTSDTVGTAVFWPPECVHPARYADKNALVLELDLQPHGHDHQEDSNTCQYAYSAYLADIWAIGLTLYIILFTTLPYSGTTLVEIFEQIDLTTAEIQFNSPVAEGRIAQGEELIARLRPLLAGCLCAEPAGRWSVENVRDFVHPFLDS